MAFQTFVRDASSETTKATPVETTTQPTPHFSEGPTEGPAEDPAEETPAGPTGQAGEETTGPTPAVVTVETEGQEGAEQTDSAPHPNQVRSTELHINLARHRAPHINQTYVD